MAEIFEWKRLNRMAAKHRKKTYEQSFADLSLVLDNSQRLRQVADISDDEWQAALDSDTEAANATP